MQLRDSNLHERHEAIILIFFMNINCASGCMSYAGYSVMHVGPGMPRHGEQHGTIMQQTGNDVWVMLVILSCMCPALPPWSYHPVIWSPHLSAWAQAEDGGGTVTPSHLTSIWKTDSGVKDAKMPGVRHESSILICLGSGMLRHEVVADSRVLRVFRKMLYLSTTQVFM